MLFCFINFPILLPFPTVIYITLSHRCHTAISSQCEDNKQCSGTNANCPNRLGGRVLGLPCGPSITIDILPGIFRTVREGGICSLGNLGVHFYHKITLNNPLSGTFRATGTACSDGFGSVGEDIGYCVVITFAYDIFSFVIA